jgi:hypothetical protein
MGEIIGMISLSGVIKQTKNGGFNGKIIEHH